jgi:hypothetical protein
MPKSEEGSDMFLRIAGLCPCVKTQKIMLLRVLSVSRCESCRIISWKTTEISEDKLIKKFREELFAYFLLI